MDPDSLYLRVDYWNKDSVNECSTASEMELSQSGISVAEAQGQFRNPEEENRPPLEAVIEK
jgi:hypothetical protein